MESGLHILLAENHRDVVRLFTMILEELGHEVTAVGSIKQARQALEIKRFDLLMCDYHLDDGTALELMVGIKAGGREMKSICISGVGLELEEGCVEAGFDVFLRKPVTFDVVESTLASLWPGAPALDLK